MSSIILEWQIRKRVIDLPNVKVLDGIKVDKLLSTNKHECITGVEIKQQGQQENIKSILADLW